jgi:CBS domain-containing protein
MQTVQTIIAKKSPHVFSVNTSASVLEAAKVMNEHRIGAVVVTEGEKVIGIFTERDVLNRIVAKQLAPAETRVGDVMTSPVAVCAPDTTRAECRAVMRERRIRHLPVVEASRLVGMISIGDLTAENEAEQSETIRYLYEYMHGSWPEESVVI